MARPGGPTPARPWDNPGVECAYYRAGSCRSCSWLELGHEDQVARKQAAIASALAGLTGSAVPPAPAGRGPEWLPPVHSAEAGFRTKAKMVVGGTTREPTLGILDADLHGVDLRDCPITDPTIRAALPGIARVVTACGLEPYDVAERRGELKYVVVTSAESGELMVRFVLRSRRMLGALRRSLPLLRAEVEGVRVVTANIHPTHEAVVEGPDEVVLTEAHTLPMRVGDVTVRLGPRSFSQTNTHVAGELYRQVARWVADGRDEGGAAPAEVWDLYCGVGGFALHAAAAGVGHVTGVEVSDQAVESAREAARDLGLSGARATFVAADATLWARDQHGVPDVVVVNPPRRGLGQDLAQWLDGSGVARVVYSSCHPDSLVRDLAVMPHLRPVEARLFDMFPHTPHAEVAVLLERSPS